MPNYDEVLEIAHENVRQLGDQLAELEAMKQTLRDAQQIPDAWDAKFREIAATTRNYTDAINAVAGTYIEGVDQVVKNSLARLDAANKDLLERINAIDDARAALGATNDRLHGEVDRLGAIDLEAHFNRHQKLLSDVFNAINSFNTHLSGVTQNLVAIQTAQAATEQRLAEKLGMLEKQQTTTQGQVKSLRLLLIGVLVLGILAVCGIGYVVLRG